MLIYKNKDVNSYKFILFLLNYWLLHFLLKFKINLEDEKQAFLSFSNKIKILKL